MAAAASSLSRTRAFPRLYNGKRQIEACRGLLPAQLQFYKENPLSEKWREQVSEDVVDFVDKVEARNADGHPTNELLPSEKTKLFRDPAKYFSRPHNVPNEAREQTYFPDFSVALIRTPHLGPRYAQFKVPLWFGKLDLKSYLKNLYNVDVNHIRSFVIHVKPDRKRPATRYSRGQRYQPSFNKKMTVELVEPFVWPAAPKEQELNLPDYGKKQFWESNIAGYEAMRREQEPFDYEPNKTHRRSIAEQAQALLSGKEKWQPTWQQLPQDVRVLQGRKKATTTTPLR